MLNRHFTWSHTNRFRNCLPRTSWRLTKVLMNRREFLTRAVGGGGQTVLCQRNFAKALHNISSEPQLLVKLDSAQTLATIPANFMGLGYEISSIARPGLLSSQNAVYGQLVRTLGKHGVIRVGGNTSDYASY